LVDEFARQLKLTAWYEWRPDTAPPRSAEARGEDLGTRPLLSSDQPESYVYCLDALRRFDGLSPDQIFAVVSEIGLLGMKGIDHKDLAVSYPLRAYPSEIFSGLHLLCLLYVGFQLYDPSVDTGLDFSDAYRQARESYGKAIH
jgi:hypothetical protein